MPLIAMNLSDKLFYQIKELVERGLYISPEAFLEIAAFNQLALERGAAPTEIIEKGHRKLRQDDKAGNGTAKPARASPGVTSLVVEQSTTRGAKATTPRRAVEAVAKVVAPPEPPVSAADYAAALKRLSLVARTEASPPPARID